MTNSRRMLRSLRRREDTITNETFAPSAEDHKKDLTHSLGLALIH